MSTHSSADNSDAEVNDAHSDASANAGHRRHNNLNLTITTPMSPDFHQQPLLVRSRHIADNSSPQPLIRADVSHDDNEKHRHSTTVLGRTLLRNKKLVALAAVLFAFVCTVQLLVFRDHSVHGHSDHIDVAVGDPRTDTFTDASGASDVSWEQSHDLNLHYHLMVINVLPYASHPFDSTGTSVTMRGWYSDRSKFAYPLCHFHNVCLTQSHVLLTFHNYTVWKFYSYLLPYCSGEFYRKFELCGCFHPNFRPRLLPYPYRISAMDRLESNKYLPQMFKDRFPYLSFEFNLTFAQIINQQREIPTNDELAAASRSESDVKSQRWYANPFTASSTDIDRPSVSKFSFRHYAGHYWSVNKWVRVHHIAHWAQKLLAMQITLGHYSHACRHTYQRVVPKLDGSDMYEGVEPEKIGPFVDNNGKREVEWLIDRQQSIPDHHNLSLLSLSSNSYYMDCLPSIDGIVFQDSYAPLTEHELNVLNVSFSALKSWTQSLGSDVATHTHPVSDADSGSARFMSLRSNRPATHSRGNIYIPPPFSPSFSLIDDVFFAQDLYQQFTAEYLADVRNWNQQLPAPVSVDSLACFDSVSFSPLFGTFGDKPYDLNAWKMETSKFFANAHHQPHYYRDVEIPAVDDSVDSSMVDSDDHSHAMERRLLSSPQGGVGSSISATTMSALSLSSCPPPRAVLIHRPDRSILNSGELVTLMRKKYNLIIEFETIDDKTPSRQQAKIFGNSGLLLASHSSQMVNVLFSHPSSAMIEVTGEFYNIDFARYATSMGIYFRYALGGEFPSGHQPVDPLMTDCLAALEQCDGDSHCISAVSYVSCKQYSFFPNKNLPFYANLSAVDRAVRQALGHILHSCYGRWANVQLTSLRST